MTDETKNAIDALKPVIAAAANRAVERSPGLDAGDAAQITADVVKETTAVVINQTNQEPWYQSRVTWGAIVAVGGGIAGIAGYSLTVEDQAAIVNNTVEIVKGVGAIAAAIGGLLTWYGRWRATKPIGQ